MYTEQMTQALSLGTPIAPQQLTATTTLNTGKIDMQLFRRALFTFQLGAITGSPTVSAAATLQTSPDGTTWANEANDVGAITISAQNTGLSKEIRAGSVTAGKRYARLQIVVTITGGTSPTVQVSGMAIGGECNHKPGSLQNDTTTWPAANQNVS